MSIGAPALFVLLPLLVGVLFFAVRKLDFSKKLIVFGMVFLVIAAVATIGASVFRAQARDAAFEESIDLLDYADITSTVAQVTGLLGVLTIAGGLLLRSGAPAPAPTTPGGAGDPRLALGPTKAFCERCGTPLTPHAVFCGACGQPV